MEQTIINVTIKIAWNDPQYEHQVGLMVNYLSICDAPKDFGYSWNNTLGNTFRLIRVTTSSNFTSIEI